MGEGVVEGEGTQDEHDGHSPESRHRRSIIDLVLLKVLGDPLAYFLVETRVFLVGRVLVGGELADLVLLHDLRSLFRERVIRLESSCGVTAGCDG